MKRHIPLALKLTLVTFLLWILGEKGLVSMNAIGRALTQYQLIVPAVLLVLGTNVLGVVRWQILLKAQGFHLSFWRTFQLTFIGNFFNLALPGAVSGDFVKAWYVAKETDGQRGRVFGSILFDRVAGVSALVLVAASALAMDWDAIQGTRFLDGILMLLVTAAACVIAFFTYLFLVRESHDPLLRLIQNAEVKFPRLGSVLRIYLGVRHYHHHRRIALQALAVSMAIHAMVCSACVLYAYALGDTEIAVLPVYIVVPLGLLVTAVPVTPAGVGTGHAAFGWLFHFLGSQRGADVFSLFILTQLLGGSIGGLIYLRFRSREPAPVLPSARANLTPANP